MGGACTLPLIGVSVIAVTDGRAPIGVRVILANCAVPMGVMTSVTWRTTSVPGAAVTKVGVTSSGASVAGELIGLGVNRGTSDGTPCAVKVSSGRSPNGATAGVGAKTTAVTTGISVKVAEGNGVCDGSGVKVGGTGVCDGTGVKVAGSGVCDGNGVNDGSSLAVSVRDGVRVLVGTGVSVTVAVSVGIAVGAMLGSAVGGRRVGVFDGVSVAVGTGVSDSVGVGVRDGVKVLVGVSVSVAVHEGV